MYISLNNLSKNQFGKIKKHTSITKVKHRFMDFGLLPGVTVEFLREAPLGDPIEIKVGRSRISLRRAEASTILVEKI